jgi:hypothetical protein
MEACTVFFQLKEEGDYLVLLTDFEIDTGESSQNIKGHKRRGAKAKARSSGSLSILIKFFCMILFDIMLCEHLASLFLNQVNFFFIRRTTRCTSDTHQKLEQYGRVHFTALCRL